MDNEQVQTENPNYWPSVAIAGLATAVIYSGMGLLSGYLTIGGSATAGQVTGILTCLIGAVGGFIVNWHYANEYEITYKIGKGALLGFLTAVAAVVFGTLISLIWTNLIDPNLNQALYDAQLTTLEQQGMSQEQIDMAMSFSPKPGTTGYLVAQVGMGLLGLGIFNAITGLIGAKIFASEE